MKEQLAETNLGGKLAAKTKYGRNLIRGFQEVCVDPVKTSSGREKVQQQTKQDRFFLTPSWMYVERKSKVDKYYYTKLCL